MSKINVTKPGSAVEESGVDVIDLLVVLAKHRKLIIGFPVVVAMIAAAATLALPNIYTATTKLLPPQQGQAGTAAILSQLGGLGSVAAGAAGLKNPNDLYIGMLHSRTVADRIISTFGLERVFDTSSAELARDRLAANTLISVEKDGLITIAFQNSDKKLVAPVANAYVTELLRLTRVLAVTEAGQRRVFYERELEQAKNRLATAESTLKGALDTDGVVNVDAESAALMATVAQLRARVSSKEIELRSMSAFVTTENPEYRRVEEELSSLRKELSRLENGSGSGQSVVQGSDSRSGLENVQRLRDVKYYQMLYGLLAKQYEAARLEEARDSSVVQVLDPAIEPERKSGPKRALMVILAGVAAFIGAILWAFTLEAKAALLTRPENAARWNGLLSQLSLRKKKI